jgi:tRNA A37 methylthiotransferase MiaB
MKVLTVSILKKWPTYINTCSVTENADKQFKQVVKKAMKLNDKAFVAAVGCSSIETRRASVC